MANPLFPLLILLTCICHFTLVIIPPNRIYTPKSRPPYLTLHLRQARTAVRLEHTRFVIIRCILCELSELILRQVEFIESRLWRRRGRARGFRLGRKDAMCPQGIVAAGMPLEPGHGAA